MTNCQNNIKFFYTLKNLNYCYSTVFALLQDFLLIISAGLRITDGTWIKWMHQPSPPFFYPHSKP